MFLDLHGLIGLSPDHLAGARGETRYAVFSRMFLNPKIPGVTMKNAAGRMSNPGQSAVYSSGRMKVRHTTNGFTGW